MFGYIRIDRGELRMREYEYYRASYCGLCRSMGKCTGQCSRMLLSYDFAFLANVRMLILGSTPVLKKRNCIAHPFHKRQMVEPNEELCYCARAAAILAYEKCRDDVADGKGFRRLGAQIKRAWVSPAYHRARRALPALASAVRERQTELGRMEARGEPSVDALANVFGELLGEVVAHGMTGSDERLARRIGFLVGRYIYILDALDDLGKDAKRGEFNPFLVAYGRMPCEQEKQGVRDALLAGLLDLEAVYDLLPEREDPTVREILNNILYLGMPQAIDRALTGRREEENK